MTTYENLRAAKRGPIVSIAAYLLLTIAKLLAGHFLNSSSLIADGFNNLSDILGNVALLIGLHLASQPADADQCFDCCCQGQSLRCCNFYWYLSRYRCSILQPDDY